MEPKAAFLEKALFKEKAFQKKAPRRPTLPPHLPLPHRVLCQAR
jgi:hypothetical protein